MSKRCWKKGVDRLAWNRVATNLQFVKKPAVPAKLSAARSACAQWRHDYTETLGVAVSAESEAKGGGRIQNGFISCGRWGPAPWAKGWVRGCDLGEGRDNGIQGLWGTTWQCPGSSAPAQKMLLCPQKGSEDALVALASGTAQPSISVAHNSCFFLAVSYKGLVDPSSAGLCWSWPTGFQEHSQSWAEQEWLASPRALSDDWI